SRPSSTRATTASTHVRCPSPSRLLRAGWGGVCARVARAGLGGPNRGQRSGRARRWGACRESSVRSAMRFGVHLPQFGRAAVTGGIERAARHAEDLGYDDVWVSDHLVIPEGQAYPAPRLYDPLMALAFAAATTSTVGVGTSVLVGPQYTSPLA